MHNTINEQIFFLINTAAGQYPFLDRFFLFVSDYFVGVLVGATALWLFFILPRYATEVRSRFAAYRSACIAALSVGITWTIVELIKGAVAFPRPVQLLEGVQVLSAYGSYDSFPSGHTAVAFAVATVVWMQSRSAGAMTYLLALLVGISRIYIGVHFPLDVLVGAVIGIAVPFFLGQLFKRYRF